MPSMNMLTNVRGLYPEVIVAADQYRHAKPDRDARNIARRLANEEALFDQTMRKLSLLWSASASEGEGRIGPDATDSLRSDLRQLEDLLRILKGDLDNASRGTEVLVKLWPRKTAIRGVPKTPLQKKLDELSGVNRRLAAYLLDAAHMCTLPLAAETSITLDYKVLYIKQKDETPAHLEVMGGKYACACQPLTLRRTLSNEPQSSEVSASIQTNFQHLDKSPPTYQERSTHIGVSLKRARDSEDSTSLTDYLRSVEARNEQTVKSQQSTTSGHSTVVHLIIKDTKHPPDATRFEDFITQGIMVLDRRRRMETAFRLSSAILLTWTSMSVQWTDWAVSVKPNDADEISLVISPRSSLGDDSRSRQSSNQPAFSVLSCDTILTRLGLHLVELAFGQTLSQMRQQDTDLVHVDEDNSDVLDLLTAKRLLQLRRIRDEFGKDYETAVSACLNQQYRESKGAQVNNITLNKRSSLDNATVAILLPLYQEVQRSFGCDCHGSRLKKTQQAVMRTGEPRGVDEEDHPDIQEPAVPRGTPKKLPIRDNSTVVANSRVPEPPQAAAADRHKDKVAPTAASHRQIKGSAPKATSPATAAPDRVHDRNSNQSQDKHDATIASSTSGFTPATTNNVDSSGTWPKDTPMASEPEVDASRPASHGVSGHVEPARQTQRILSGRYDLETESEYSIESSSGTTDSQFAWVSDDTEDLPSIADDHPLMRYREVALRVALRSFQAVKELASGASEISGPAQLQNGAVRKRTRKRKNKDRRSDDEEDDDGAHENGTATDRKRAKKDAITFACPFFKKDSNSHQHCCTYLLSRIRDVKQHLTRRHQIPPYCAICGQTFQDENTRDTHLRDAQCERRPMERPEGITESQKRQLQKKAQPGQAPDQQWYAIFDILFPGYNPRPDTPYIDSSLFTDVFAYQRFLGTHGRDILMRVLTNNGAVVWTPPPDENNLAGFQQRIMDDGIQQIMNAWTIRCATSTAAAAATATATARAAAGAGEDEDASPGALDEVNMAAAQHDQAAFSNYGDEQQAPEMQQTSSAASFVSSSYGPSSQSWDDGAEDWLTSLNLNSSFLTPQDSEELRRIHQGHGTYHFQ